MVRIAPAASAQASGRSDLELRGERREAGAQGGFGQRLADHTGRREIDPFRIDAERLADQFGGERAAVSPARPVNALALPLLQTTARAVPIAVREDATTPVDGRRRAQALGEGAGDGRALGQFGEKEVGPSGVADAGRVGGELQARDRREVGKGIGRKR